jgi:predicted Zn-dependent protease
MSWPLRAIVALALLVAGCSEDPAPDYEPGISEESRELGAEQHPKLLEEFGGEYPGRQQAYVKKLGARLAAAAGLGDECTFTLVNSDVVNAFAVPGCYIYVTRGLMAVVTSEAELASVLGHEVGHILARHSERQQSRQLWSVVGVIAASLTGSERLTRIAGAAAELFTMRYSRKQEYEADELGMRYLKQAGYDPYAASDMLAALMRQESFLSKSGGRDEAKGVPEWARSHPLTEKRIDRVKDLAEATGIKEDALPEKEADYLAAIDGLLYGDDPQQGFVLGRRFAHPVMRIGFEAPEGFTLTNSPRAIGISGPDDLRGEFSGGRIPPGGLEAYADALIRELLGEATAEIDRAHPTRINGVPAILLSGRVATAEGNVSIALAVYDGGGGEAYHIVMVSPSGAGAAAIQKLFASFHLLDDQAVARLKPRRIDVVTVAAGESEQSLARRVADPHGPALLRTLNGDIAIRPGRQIKIVTDAAAP